MSPSLKVISTARVLLLFKKLKVSKDTALATGNAFIDLAEIAAKVCPEPIASSVLATVVTVYREVVKVSELKDRLKGLDEHVQALLSEIPATKNGEESSIQLGNVDDQSSMDEAVQELEMLAYDVKRKVDKWRKWNRLQTWSRNRSLDLALTRYEQRLREMVSLYKLLKQFKTHSNLVESKQVLEDALQVASQSGQTTTGQQGPQAPELYYLEQHFRIDSGAHHLHRACKRASDGGTQYIAKYFKLMTPEDEFLKNKLAHCLEYYKDLPPHPNIMKAREMVDKVASKHSGIFLISEYHERGNLTQFCQDAENKYFNVLTLLAEVAEALAHMHKHDRPHGAIRGNNVLISKDSHAIVHDFECMRFFMDHSDHPWMPPHQYEIHYKVAWHRNEFDVRWYAPEIVVPDVLEEDPATEVFRVHQTRAGDVWSFGALILELYSEMRPYNNWRRPSAVVMCLTERELPPMPEEWNVLWMSRELFDFMKELLVIKPEDRPTMDYVAERMRQFEKAYVPKVPKRRAS